MLGKARLEDDGRARMTPAWPCGTCAIQIWLGWVVARVAEIVRWIRLSLSTGRARLKWAGMDEATQLYEQPRWAL